MVRSGHGRHHAAEAEEAGFRVVSGLPEAIDIFLAGLRR
jgi:hypothetical protein